MGTGSFKYSLQNWCGGFIGGMNQNIYEKNFPVFSISVAVLCALFQIHSLKRCLCCHNSTLLPRNLFRDI
jgi:hypothetical protein